MRSARMLVLSLAIVLAAAPAAVAAGLQNVSTVERIVVRGKLGPPAAQVSLSRDRVSTQLGDSFGFTSKVTNTGTKARSGLVAHLNVVGLSSGIYVDPEDWSEERTKTVPSLGQGESTDISWNVKAVTGGHAAIYVVVLPDDPASAREPLVVSPALDVRIAETTDLNTDGVLPLTLAVPALIAAGTLLVRRRRTR
jgi:hypothetical protein